MATRKRAVRLSRPELSERPYDFSKPDDAEAGEVGQEKKTEGAREITPHHPLPLKGRGGGFISQRQEKTDKDRADLDELQQRLLALSPSDRRDLLARVSLAEKEANGGRGRDLETWAGAVVTALADATGLPSGAGAGHANVRRLLADSSAWVPVRSFWEHSGFQELKVPEQQVAWNLLASLLVRHAQGIAQRGGLPLTPKLAASCAPNLAAVFDSSFPGYARGNPRLMSLLMRQMLGYRAPTEEVDERD